MLSKELIVDLLLPRRRNNWNAHKHESIVERACNTLWRTLRLELN